MIYINVGEMCFIPMNIQNELFNCVRQLRRQHLSYVVSTFSTSIRLLSPFFIKHCILPPSFSLFLSLCLSSRSVVPHPVILISGLEMLMLSSCNPKFFAVRNVHCPGNTTSPSDHFYTDAVMPSSDHCRTQAIMPPSGHYCTETVAPSSEHYCIDIVQ